ncbi:MAG: putative metallopeptidase [Candidatus Methanoperedens sp.]|nr:putative metallopeptidase [Candidatus Methanoperedens sp.]MCZ7369391.1 putative metallopeptidase [Candidatus Methanoperedens sp.]
MRPGNSDKNNPEGFDFTGNMTLLVEDIAKTHPSFSHIQLNNILIAISPSNGSRNGVVAKMRPMRYEGGSKTRVHRGIEYITPEVNINGKDILYIVYFHLPRFLNHKDHKNKLATVLHELYHISPLFNGDVRRFSGKNYAHGSSRKKYDNIINIFTDEYIKATAHPELSAFLEYKYSELRHKYGAINGNMIRIARSKPVV